MEIAYVSLILSLIIVLGIAVKKKQSQVSKNKRSEETSPNAEDLCEFPYLQKKLFTRSEAEFFRFLKPLCDDRGLLLFSKVSLKDVLVVTNKEQYKSYFYKISQKHVDFIVCDQLSNVLFAIELDGKSHDNPKAKENDEFKNEVFKRIGLPLHRFRVGAYEALEQTIFN